MAGGITIQKNYITTNITSNLLANNWAALVLGVTSRGPTEPTLVQTYAEFVDKFGTAVPDMLTHTNISYLLSNRVPVLFKRLVDKDKIANASAVVNSWEVTDDKQQKTTKTVTVQASDSYSGAFGNLIVTKLEKAANSNICFFNVYYKSSKDAVDLGDPVEVYQIGIMTADISIGDLFYDFIDEAINSNTPFSSKYIKFPQVDLGNKTNNWHSKFEADATAKFDQSFELKNGSDGDQNTLASALAILKDYSNSFWNDNKLKNASVYYPQLRLLSTGGITASTETDQNDILTTLGRFSVDCEKSFRILVDYPLSINTISTKSITNVVRDFALSVSMGKAKTETTDAVPAVDPSVYAYVGTWGADGNNNYLPGSTGFLAALGRSNYNVYSRRVAGTSFNPGFTKSYDNLYVDAIKDWQDPYQVQLNPIVIIDNQDNLAVMGSSTLALPTSSLSAKNPAQALDVVMVGDYITALLNNIALRSLKASLDRLSLNSLNNDMSNAVNDFVTSRAISRYNLVFDTTQLGKLGIECTLYFPVGLDEVSLTVTSTYDTTVI